MVKKISSKMNCDFVSARRGMQRGAEGEIRARKKAVGVGQTNEFWGMSDQRTPDKTMLQALLARGFWKYFQCF